MGLSKEGLPCKNSAAAEWYKDFAGQSLLVRLGVADHSCSP
jgi:hypothetical protein